MRTGIALTIARFSFAMALAASSFAGAGTIEAQSAANAEKAPEAERRQAVSQSISTLLKRNLNDVFGENDPARRRAAIDEIYTDDIVFYESSKNVFRGRNEIDRIAGTLRAQHPDFRYQVIGGPEEVANGGRIQWLEGRPGEAPAVAGTDFIIARDGRIAAIYLFFDELR